MTMKTIFSRSRGVFGVGPAAVSKTETMRAGLPQSSVRGLHDVRSLAFWGPLLNSATTPEGLSALSKMSLVSESALRGSEAGFEKSVAMLNASTVREPGSLSTRFGLTHPETIGLALTVLQAGTKLRANVDTPAVASLMFHLLSSRPVEAPLLGTFEKYAQALAKDVLPYTHVLSQSADWHDRPGAERHQAVENTFDQLYPLARSSGLAAGSAHSVSLSWSPDISPFSGLFAVAPDYGLAGSQGDGSGAVTLSRQLIDADSKAFAEKFGDAPEVRNLASALILPLISHEIFHGSQHGNLDVLNGEQPATRRQWAQAVQHAISIGTQSVIVDSGLPTASAETRVLPHLLHEKEAWALTFTVIKAMVNSQSVPDRCKSALQDYMVNNFDVFSPFNKLGPTPTSTLPSGQLWNDAGELCVAAPAFNRAYKQEQVRAFLSSPSRAAAASPETTVKSGPAREPAPLQPKRDRGPER
jgi:hypothetical protein